MVAGERSEAKNNIHESDYVKSRGWLKYSLVSVGGDGTCCTDRGDSLWWDHGLFIYMNSRDAKYVGADAGKWNDAVVGVCTILFWSLISSVSRKPRKKMGSVVPGVWGERRRDWESTWTKKVDMAAMNHYGRFGVPREECRASALPLWCACLQPCSLGECSRGSGGGLIQTAALSREQ